MNTGYHLYKFGKMVAKDIAKNMEGKRKQMNDLNTISILSEFRKSDLSEVDNIYLVTKYNHNGQLDEYLKHYFTFAQYYLFLASHSISFRKPDQWKAFVFKDFTEKYGLGKFKGFLQMFNPEGRSINVNLWKVLVPDTKKYLCNDVIARFEKEYVSRDFAAERHKKCSTPIMDIIISKFGEEKGNNLCAAVYTYMSNLIPRKDSNTNPLLHAKLWTNFCCNKCNNILGKNGSSDFL